MHSLNIRGIKMAIRKVRLDTDEILRKKSRGS